MSETVHLTPLPNGFLTPCCGKSPFSLMSDRMTNDVSLVTCAHNALEEYKKAESDLSNAYMRLRRIIPNALRTRNAPTAEQVWAHTESCAKQVVDMAYSSFCDVLADIKERTR